MMIIMESTKVEKRILSARSESPYREKDSTDRCQKMTGVKERQCNVRTKQMSEKNRCQRMPDGQRCLREKAIS